MTSAPEEPPYYSVATDSFAPLLRSLGVTLVVSTYQSGCLILVRPEGATTINTRLQRFESPMGIAVEKDRLAFGTGHGVWDYRSQPSLLPVLEPRGVHDVCYLPRRLHVTGDIRIHEVAFASGELWLVNTRFSALCTLDDTNSFVPRWKPPFITHLAPEDRCHLNGMAIVDGRVRFATALGATNTADGWREQKARWCADRRGFRGERGARPIHAAFSKAI
jgi:uncharacterized protein (TIGR03032 family)